MRKGEHRVRARAASGGSGCYSGGRRPLLLAWGEDNCLEIAARSTQKQRYQQYVCCLGIVAVLTAIPDVFAAHLAIEIAAFIGRCFARSFIFPSCARNFNWDLVAQEKSMVVTLCWPSVGVEARKVSVAHLAFAQEWKVVARSTCIHCVPSPARRPSILISLQHKNVPDACTQLVEVNGADTFFHLSFFFCRDTRWTSRRSERRASMECFWPILQGRADIPTKMPAAILTRIRPQATATSTLASESSAVSLPAVVHGTRHDRHVSRQDLN